MLVGNCNDQNAVITDRIEQLVGETVQKAFADFATLKREGERVLSDPLSGLPNFFNELTT